MTSRADRTRGLAGAAPERATGWCTGGARRGARATGGAVYVEFLIAFMPFFVFFLCLWQISILYYTKLMVDHAAYAAARAAAVIVAENPNRVDLDGGPKSVNVTTDSRMGLVRTAAELALAPLILDGTILSVDLVWPSQPVGDDALQHKTIPGMGESAVSLMRVRVETTMNCKIAFANAIMCPPRSALGYALKFGLGMFVLPVKSEAVFPYQGASYVYDPDDDKDDGTSGSSAQASNFGGFCFVAGTPVETALGPRPIEEVRAGDLVLTRDEATGVTSTGRVARTFVTPDQTVLTLALDDGDPLTVTPEHQFWTLDRGWVPAQDLQEGEALATADGHDLHVFAVSAPAGAHETVYNFEVERTHTYFVGDADAWVHNQCTAKPPGGWGAPSGNGSGIVPGGGSGGGGKDGGGGGHGGGGKDGGKDAGDGGKPDAGKKESPLDDPAEQARVRAPAGRHYGAKVTPKSLPKDNNTIIAPGVDVAGDVADIRAGKAQRIGDTYVVNGRTYGTERDSKTDPFTLYPIATPDNPGFKDLDRNAYKLLGLLNKYGGDTPEARDIIAKNPNNTPADIAAAVDAWHFSHPGSP